MSRIMIVVEFERIPIRDRSPHRLAILLAAKHAQRGGAMVREIGMDVAPAASFRRIHAHHRITLVSDFAAVHFEIMAAA